MFSCFAPEKKKRNSALKNIEEDHNKINNNEDIVDIHMENLKRMDENSLNQLKTKLNTEYRAILYENQLNNDKIILYKKLIEEYKKTVNEEDNDVSNNNIKNYIEIRNSILDKEILEMKNKNNDLHKEYLSLFDSLSLLTDPYSKYSRLSEKIYILENKIQEQENKLKYLEERCKYFSNSNNINNDMTKDIFLELFENKSNEDNLNLIEEKSSESSSSSSSSSSEKEKEPINTIGNNVGDIKESNKIRTRNTMPKEAVEDYKRMLSLIYKKNYEQVTKEYQKVIAAAQNELLNKNNNLKKLELIKNEIEMTKDPSKKMKMLNEEEKIINEKKIKEKEKKKEFKQNKKIFLEKRDEYEELKKNLDILNNELKKEEEELNLIEKKYKENNDTLNQKIEEGNKIQIELDEIKNQRDLLLIELFGNQYNNDNLIINKNDEENKNEK